MTAPIRTSIATARDSVCRAQWTLRPKVAAALLSAVVCVALTTACGQPRGTDRLLAARARTPPPSSNGTCSFDLTESKADTVFFVLGMLNEYLGRNIVEDEDRVEEFFCNEAETARLFRRDIVRLAAEQGLDPTIRDETIQVCLVMYHSKAIASRLNSCYRYQASSGEVVQGSDGTYRRVAKPSLEMQLFMRSGHGSTTEHGWPEEVFYRRRALAYLAGAWSRYGREGDFVFANAKDKANLVAQLLMALGCHGVRVESTFGLIPQTNTVHFIATDEVREWLQKTW